MSELKPCPFCGESKLLYSGGCGFRYDDDDNQIRLFHVHCRTCKGRTGLFESLDEAIEAWNRRTNSTTIQPSALGTNLAEVGMDCISRQAAIDALDKRFDSIPMEQTMEILQLRKDLRELPSAQIEQSIAEWQKDFREYINMLNIPRDDYKGIMEYINEVPSAQPERTCVNCGRTANNGGWYADGGTRCPIEERYALPKDGYCHLWEKRNVTDDDYPERRTDE